MVQPPVILASTNNANKPVDPLAPSPATTLLPEPLACERIARSVPGAPLANKQAVPSVEAASKQSELPRSELLSTGVPVIYRVETIYVMDDKPFKKQRTAKVKDLPTKPISAVDAKSTGLASSVGVGNSENVQLLPGIAKLAASGHEAQGVNQLKGRKSSYQLP